MHPIAVPALRAGDVIVCGGRFYVLVSNDADPGHNLRSVLVKRGPLNRLRSHVVPDLDELRAAGLPLSDIVVCCDRLRPVPGTCCIKLGTASPELLRQIACTLKRVAAAIAIEATPPIRSTIWREPGGDRGRQVGAKSLS